MILEQSARRLLERGGDDDVEHILGLIVRGAIRTVPHVQHAGITLVERGAVEAWAPSSRLVRDLDRLQNDLGEGPCLDAIWSEHRTVVEDMETANDRWPRFAPAAARRGIRSLLSFQLFAERGSAGALNLYAAEPGVFDDRSADIGAMFAAQAALALHGAKRVAGLNLALASRDIIGEAKGILIERFDVAPEQAFAMLSEASQHTNLKLVDVATWLVDDVARRRRSRRRQ